MSIKKFAVTIGAAAMSGGAVLLVGWQADAEPNRTTMPDIDKLVHYTTVTRGDVTEHLMTTREAIEAVKSGKPIPAGTHVALVDYRDGKVFRYFIMEKGRAGEPTTTNTAEPQTGNFSGSSPTGRSTWRRIPPAASHAIPRGLTGTSVLVQRDAAV